MKTKGQQSAVKERVGTPILRREKDGSPVIECPFCKPTHPLSISSPSACGTLLQLRAVQTIYKGKFNKALICVKCQQGGGDLVQFNDAFIHTHDCAPGVVTFAEPPKFSMAARLVFKMPAWMKKMIEKRLGEAKVVEEVLPDGTRTGRHLGYFFHMKA